MLNKFFLIPLLLTSSFINADSFKIKINCNQCIIKNESTQNINDTWTLKFKQVNYSSMDTTTYSELINDNYSHIRFYHSEELYIDFNKKINNSNASYYNTIPLSDAIIVNSENILLGDHITVRTQSPTSAIITGYSINPWCNIVHGRFNGTCRNGNYGIGDWSIYVK